MLCKTRLEAPTPKTLAVIATSLAAYTGNYCLTEHNNRFVKCHKSLQAQHLEGKVFGV